MAEFSPKQKLLAMRVLLTRRFPACFMPKGEPHKLPLKIGIRDDILQRCEDLPYKWVREALNDYCSGPKYTASMKAGAPRVDLDGETAGTVSETDQANAEFRERARIRKSQQYKRDLKTTKEIQGQLAKENAA